MYGIIKKVFSYIFGWNIFRAKINTDTNAMIFFARRWGNYKQLALIKGNHVTGYTPALDLDLIANTFFSINHDFVEPGYRVSDAENLYTYRHEASNPERTIVDAITGRNVMISNIKADIKAFMFQAYLRSMLDTLASYGGKLYFRKPRDLNKRFIHSEEIMPAHLQHLINDIITSNLSERFKDINIVKRFIKTYLQFQFNPRYRDLIYTYDVQYIVNGDRVDVSITRCNEVINEVEITRGDLCRVGVFKDYGFNMEYFMFQYLFLNTNIFKNLANNFHVSQGINFFKED